MECLNLMEILNYLKKYKKNIVIVIILFSLFGILFVKLFNKAFYVSETSFTVFSVRNDGYTYVDGNTINTYSDLLISRNVLNSINEKLDFEISFDELRNSISVLTKEKSALITINVTHQNKNKSIKIAEAFSNFIANNLNKLINTKTIKVSLTHNIIDADIIYKYSNLRVVLIFILVGIAIGFGLVLIKYYFDTSVKSLEFLKNKFDHWIIGNIHKSKNNNLEVEDFKILHNNIEFGKSDIKSILLTSSTDRENKDYISYNLAKSFALNGDKTVLLDCNIVNSKIGEYFKIKSKNLPKIIKEYNHKYIDKTDVDNLYILITDANCKINAKDFKVLLNNLNKDFDRIIINGVPLIGFGDSLMYSNCVDGVLLVVKLNDVLYDEVKDAEMRLEKINANVMGIVVYDVPSKNKVKVRFLKNENKK